MTDWLTSEMVRNQRLLTLREDATVAEACRQLHDRRVGAVMVTNADGHLLGIFTGRDAVRIMAQECTVDGRLEAAMTHSPGTMPPGRPAVDALRLMQDGGFRHLPVVDGGQLVDVVFWGDFRPSEHDRLDVENNLLGRI
jgi:CBS domain-containing protein